MRVSLNEIKKYVNIPADVSTEDLVKLIGSRLVEVEEAIDLAPKYKNAYIVKVAECEPIEGTHLHLCQIDTGADKVQVVCGAPNVRRGMLAVWLAPGAIVPQTYGEENFKLGVRKLQGYESNGMLAGLDELDLGDDHSGIVELDPSMDFPGTTRNIQPGDSFAEAFELNDIILDIENKSLTHRPDTFGLIGFAREVAGILDINFAKELDIAGSGNSITKGAEQSFTFSEHVPDGQLAGREGDTRKDGLSTGLAKGKDSSGSGKNAKAGTRDLVQIKIADKAICPRYSCAVIEMSDATETTKYLTPDAVFLAKAGMRAINKIVDVTNILMLRTGQPLHAFDYDKFIKAGGTKSPKVGVRLGKDGEELQLLDGKTIKCTPDDILITSNDQPVALAGAMGGASTEIDASTKKVFLESATFSLYNLRKTQMYHGIFSEAITRFTKGQPAGQTAPVLDEAIKMLGGELVATADAYPGRSPQPVVKITTAEINSLLGTNYETNDIVKTLENVGLVTKASRSKKTEAEQSSTSRVHAPDGQLAGREGAPRKDGRATGHLESGNSVGLPALLTVKVPYWRTDIHIKEDLIEEIGRLKGFDNIPQSLPKRPFIGATPDPLLKLKKQIRTIMSDSLAGNELLTYTFVNKKLQQSVGEDPADSYEIINSISPDLQVLRQSLVPSLLEKAHLNLKAGYRDFTLYEMNQVTKKSYGKTSDKVPVVHHHLAAVITGDYYRAKALLTAFLNSLGIKNLDFTEFKTGPAYLEPLHSATVQPAGVSLGEVRSSVLKNLKISQPISAFELDLEALLSSLPAGAASSIQLSKYPSVSRDITLKVPADTDFAAVERAVSSSLSAEENLIFTLTPASIFQKDQKTKNISFELTFSNTKKTLESSEISDIMERVVGSAAKLGASVV